jgi:phage terminase Nu1 subunit (DNA packaging protein)
MPNTAHKDLSVRAMASALDLAPSSVQELKEKGMPMRSASAARAWRAKNLNKAQQPRDPVEAEDFMVARARKESASADIAEMEAAKMRGELVEADAVSRASAAQAGRVREAILQLADRLAPVLEMRPLGFVRQTLDTELRAALQALSEG